MSTLLHVTDLRTTYVTHGGGRPVAAVDGVSFDLERGECLGLVGESGSGKTTTCLSIVGLLPAAARIDGGSIEFDGQQLVGRSAEELSEIRGRQIAMILQDPMASLNPLLTIYDQVAEPAYYHRGARGTGLRRHVLDLLRAVRIPSPEVRMAEYPHQMSGGMRQRVVGAIALSAGPQLIIADEPTTNLDVTIQAQYLNLLKDLQRRTGVSLLFVTHNLGIVAHMCDRVAVMYAGQIVEQGPVRDLFQTPRHPYTQALLRSIPKLGSREPLYAIPGQPPDLAELPGGCAFHPRCPRALETCASEAPPETAIAARHLARCWLLNP
ncbi:MAG: ABC transporter ATP-binding protein [Chloroflexi bacterium]|nr:ABC transporter ATP-binding protein [Chloroflexota bacterium]MBV9597203.1 ABC transporter ATP-binding protein [Chloroflexota bacterium]